MDAQELAQRIRDNVNAQRRNHPDSEAATKAREENRALFAEAEKLGLDPAKVLAGEV